MARPEETATGVNTLQAMYVITEFIRVAGLLDLAHAHDLTADSNVQFLNTMLEIAGINEPLEFIDDFEEIPDKLLVRLGGLSVTANVNRHVAEREYEAAFREADSLASRFYRDMKDKEISVTTVAGTTGQIEIFRRIPSGYGTYSAERVDSVDGLGYLANPHDNTITLVPESKRFARNRRGIAHYLVHLLDDTNRPLVELS